MTEADRRRGARLADVVGAGFHSASAEPSRGSAGMRRTETGEKTGMLIFRRSWVTGLVAGALSLGGATAVAGCRSNPSDASSAGSAASSVVSQGASILGQIKDGVDAASDVKAGPVSVGADGHATAEITASNPTGSEHDYTVAVSFSDQNGVRDVVVVNVPEVAAHGSGTASARSTRKLSGPLTAKVTAAVRH